MNDLQMLWYPKMLWYPFLFSVLIAFSNYYQSRLSKGYIVKGNRPLYSTRFGVGTPIVFFCFAFVITRFFPDAAFTSFIAGMLVLSAGLSVMLLLLPLLRKFLCAESCAHLWNVPWVLLFFSGLIPCWTISLPFPPPSKQFSTILFGIWLAGFILVMLWSILSHLRFRHQLLKNARPVLDETYQQVWQRQLRIANLPTDKISLCISPDTETPLSIGLHMEDICLVLPEKNYAPEELALILQHELIHISRRDSMLKFTMCLLAAFMWFNPLVWIAMRVCAQDLELSCDETVLYGHPQPTRMEYARLLLNSAPKQQGFTTCLSASASTLRYRLKSIVSSRKRIVGSILVGVLCCLILLGGMCTGVRYQAMPAQELIFGETDVNQMEVGQMYYGANGLLNSGECEKEQLLLEYITSLSIRKISGELDIYSATTHMQITIRTPECSYMVTFGDCYLRVVTTVFSQDWQTTAYYQLDTEPDWELMRSCIGPYTHHTTY